MPDPDAADLRIGHLLGSNLSDESDARLVIIGFPCDIGVVRNNGRPGAAGGPDAIRRMLYKMTPDAANDKPFVDILCHTLDLGNLNITDLEESQEDLGNAIEPYLSRDLPVVILGGGHETAYGHFLGYSRGDKMINILNWDAHTDVREMKQGKGHSGSPFRQALEHASKLCGTYIVAGLQPHAVSSSHLDWIRSRQGETYFADHVDSAFVKKFYGSMDQPHFATFDLDAVDQNEAPGVSAPAVAGLDSKTWLHAAYEAGRCPWVSSMDIVELNPDYDKDNMTARLAAKTVWMFIKGLAERK